MIGPGNATERAALRELWHRWAAVIEQFARRRRGRRRLSGREYHALYGELLQVCRSLAASADGQARGFYEGLESVVQPWLTLWALQQADREILFNLVERCQQAGQVMGGPPWRFRARAWARLGLVLAAFALLSWAGNRVWELGREHGADATWALRWTLARPGEFWWLGLAIVATLGAIWLVMRTARS